MCSYNDYSETSPRVFAELGVVVVGISSNVCCGWDQATTEHGSFSKYIPYVRRNSPLRISTSARRSSSNARLPPPRAHKPPPPVNHRPRDPLSPAPCVPAPRPPSLSSGLIDKPLGADSREMWTSVINNQRLSSGG